MGIFDLFKNKEELKDSPWHIIESEAELKRAIEESYHHKVAIFKHSTRCFISKMVLKNFENGLRNSTPSDYKFYYLDLLQFKPLSNKISEDLMIRHESPQRIVLEGGKAIYNASHENISTDLLP